MKQDDPFEGTDLDTINAFFAQAHNLIEEEDPVNKPRHYTNKSIECIDYIDDTVPDCYSFYFGSALKYLTRHLEKNKPIQDLEKCIWYINRMIEDNK